MWKYTTSERIETEYESFNGWTHKYDMPRHYIIHRIMNNKEIVVETAELINTKRSKQVAKNFQTIVDAVNGTLLESGNRPV
jgi:hypothetical protein